MRNTKRRPVTVGEMLTTEFLEPMNIEIRELADAMGVHRNTLSRIVHDKGALTAPMAIKLAAALGKSPEFWLSIQHAVEVWDVAFSQPLFHRFPHQHPIVIGTVSYRISGVFNVYLLLGRDGIGQVLGTLGALPIPNHHFGARRQRATDHFVQR